VQLIVAFRTDYPNDGIVGSISCGNPWRTLAALVGVPSERHGRRIRRSNLVSPNFAACAEDKIRSLSSGVRGR
jgi:hypothetical protein